MKRVLLLVAVILLVEPLAVYAQSSLLPSLPELLQKLHDLYADDYPKFTAAFSEAVKSPTKTTYGEELKTNVNMCEFYGRMIGQDSMRLMKKVASPAADKDEQKGTINELLWLHQQLASTNFFIDDAMLKLSFETGVDWRHVFYKLQSESVFYQDVLNTRIQQLITTTL